MNTKNNKRSQNTDEAIIRAAFEAMLMGGKQISRITVREICELAHINRSTFYAHYMDVYDLFEKVEMQMAQMCSERIMAAQGFRGIMEECFRFIMEYKDFYQIYFSEVNKFSHLIEMMASPFREQLGTLHSRDLGYGIEGEAAYHFRFFTAGVGALLAYWLERNCRESPEELCGILVRQYSDRSMFGEWLGQG